MNEQDLREYINDLMLSVTTSFAGLDAELLSHEDPTVALDADMWSASVHTSGGWTGQVVVNCSPGFARQMATAMFATEEVDNEDAADALQELTNVIGGNLKSMFASFQEAPCYFSLPVIQTAPRELPPDGRQRFQFRLGGDRAVVDLQGDPPRAAA